MYEKNTLNCYSRPPFMRLPVPYAAHDGRGKYREYRYRANQLFGCYIHIDFLEKYSP